MGERPTLSSRKHKKEVSTIVNMIDACTMHVVVPVSSLPPLWESGEIIDKALCAQATGRTYKER